MASVLVIDDDEMFRRLVCKLIENAGHEPIAAASGEEGIELASQKDPDLIVTDMNMPGMTGWEMIRRLRAEEATATTPVVVVSAHETSRDRDEAFEAGCSAYVNKTIDPDTLIGKIVSQLP